MLPHYFIPFLTRIDIVLEGVDTHFIIACSKLKISFTKYSVIVEF